MRAALPASPHRVMADNLAARRELVALHGGTRSTAAAWSIIEPARGFDEPVACRVLSCR